MKVALVITVKNERDLLRHNIRYHQYLGVDQFYIYDDGCTDETIETVADLAFVRTAPSVPREAFRDHPGLKLAYDNYHEIHTSRQILNIFDAMNRARDCGADWLVNIDADELLCLDTTHSRAGHLKDALDQLDLSIDVVSLPVLEILQRRTE